MKRIWISALILCFLSIGGFALMQTQIDRIRPSRERLEEKLIYIPETSFLKTASLGFRAVLADVLWARSVVYFGGHYLTDRDYRWLYHILDATTTLDPKNILAYRFGGTLLALEGDDVEKSIMLLKKGIRDNPDADWRLYFQLGFNYFFCLNEYSTAAEYLERASKMPGHPAFLPRLTARMYAKSGKTDMALEFLEETYSQYDDEKVKQAIAGRINTLRAMKYASYLEKVAEEYERIYGKYPGELKELINTGLIQKLPEFPDGYYEIDSAGKVKWVSESNWP